MSAPTERILITGGLGRIGTVLCQQLKGRYITRSYDLRPQEEADENAVGNITDIQALAQACEEVRAVVHLAAIPGNADFNLLLDTNIRGTYCVYEAARIAGVQKVVFASTNHVSGMWEKAGVHATPDMPVRPDSLYAVSKAAGEAAARYYADAHGIASVCLRIGGFSPRNKPGGVRSLYTLCTHRDMGQLVDKAVQSEKRFAIVNGVSNHPKAYQDLQAGRDWIGYEPQDSAEDWLDQYSPEDQEKYRELQWRKLNREEMLKAWTEDPPERK